MATLMPADRFIKICASITPDSSAPLHFISKAIIDSALVSGADVMWPAKFQGDGPPVVLQTRDIYSGSAGIIYGLFAVYQYTKWGYIRQFLLSHCAPLCSLAQVHEPQSFYTGSSGRIYVAALVGSMMDPSILAVARDTANGIVEVAATRQPEHYDLINGAAGTIMGLLMLRRVFPELPINHALAHQCEYLCDTACPAGRGMAWFDTVHSSLAPLCGLSHGAAGVANALMHCAIELKNHSLSELAASACRYESGLYRRYGFWPDFRLSDKDVQIINELTYQRRAGLISIPGIPRRMEMWCHGSVGIALARIGMRQLFPSVETSDMLKEAIESVPAGKAFEERLAATISICHGGSGYLVADCLARIATGSGLLENPTALKNGLVSAFAPNYESVRNNLDGATTDATLFCGYAGMMLALLPLEKRMDLLGVVLPSAALQVAINT